MSLPALRFSEFTYNWQMQALGEVSEKIQDGTHFSPVASEAGDYMYLTSKNVKNGYIDLSNITYISSKSHNEIYKRCDVRYGDVLVTKDGTIGQVCVNTLNEPFSLLSSVAFIRAKTNYNNYFLYHLLLSPNGQAEINKSIAGQALQRITLTKLNGYKYFFPNTLEQTKIANFLTAVDEKITQLTQKHVLLAQYKKGVMQQIFSQKLRFKDDDGQDFPEWEEKIIEQIADVKGGKRLAKGFSLQSENNGKPYITVSVMYEGGVDVANIKYVPTETAESIKNYKIGVNDIFISVAGTLGIVGIVPNELNNANLTENANKLTNLKCNQKYLLQYLMSDKFKMLIDGVKTTNAQPKLAIYAINSFAIHLPNSASEQTKIANFLTAIDDKLAQTQAKLAAAKQYKQGLLQQMFV